MTLESEELSRLDAKIRSLAQAYLSSGRPYLLSRLGKDLGDDLKLVKIGYGRSLGEYVSERLADDYSVILMGQHNNIQAIISATESTSSAFLEDFPAPAANRGPRFNYRFWAAFSVPLIEGRRWLDLDDFTFKDITDEPEGEYKEIPADLIAPPEAQDRDILIKGNIAKWLDAEGLSQDRFTAKPPMIDGRNSPVVGGRSILEAVIQALDRKQLASTTLSLDVVADLLRRRV